MSRVIALHPLVVHVVIPAEWLAKERYTRNNKLFFVLVVAE